MPHFLGKSVYFCRIHLNMGRGVYTLLVAESIIKLAKLFNKQTYNAWGYSVWNFNGALLLSYTVS